MNSIVNLGKYRTLPISSLVTGILSFTFLFYAQIAERVYSFLATQTQISIIGLSLFYIPGICLPITAIVCGSIDLKRIKKGLHKNKAFRGMDITGIILGSIILLIFALLHLYWYIKY